MGNGIIQREDSAYPKLLRGIKNPPEQLYWSGDRSILNTRCVAVVGSRTSTVYGRKTAQAIGRQLAAAGVTVVSGMAMGIDTSAHEGALEAGGKTIAILGCGTDICYPPENRILMEQIRRQGLILSEYAPGTPAARYHFPNRNRIISGLCEATVIVQARNRSGALITAELAAEQGRDVFAVPGNIDSQYNMGNNRLIKEGVTPLLGTDDVLDYLGLSGAGEEDARRLLSEREYRIYQILRDEGEMSVDEVCMRTGFTPAYVNPILSVMEMKGFIDSEMGRVFPKIISCK